MLTLPSDNAYQKFNGNFDFSKTKYIKKYFFEKMRKGILEDRDILIYKDGAYIGRSTLFQDNFYII